MGERNMSMSVALAIIKLSENDSLLGMVTQIHCTWITCAWERNWDKSRHTKSQIL